MRKVNVTRGDLLSFELIDSLVQALKELQGLAVLDVQWPLLRVGGTLMSATGGDSVVLVEISGPAEGGGKYLGRVLFGSCTVDESTNLAMPEGLSGDSGEDALILNPAEDGQDTHDLTDNLDSGDTVYLVGKEIGTTDTGLRIVVASQTKQAPFIMFAVRVWQDGGTTDGDLTNKCDRTYTVRTADATAPDTGGKLLGEDMTPLKVRPSLGLMLVPPVDGDGVLGQGYFDGSGTFFLYDANETAEQEECTT